MAANDMTGGCHHKAPRKLIDFENEYRAMPPKVSIRNQLMKCIHKHCNPRNIIDIFPFIDTVRSYRVKEYLANDVIAGLTCGCMAIPLGLAYAALSSLPHIIGLYMAFSMSLVYFLFGTSKHLNLGCVAVVSLMVSNVLVKYDSDQLRYSIHRNITSFHLAQNKAFHYDFIQNEIRSKVNVTAISSHQTEKKQNIVHEVDEKMRRRIDVASCLAIYGGFAFIILSTIGLHRIFYVMSDSLINGLTFGIAFQVVSTQIASIFGIPTKRHAETGAVFLRIISVLKNISDTNLVVLSISICCILILYCVKKFINEKYGHKMRVPIPIEMLLMVMTTIISKYLKLNSEYNVKIMGLVELDLPTPRFPDLSLGIDYIGDSILIVVVAYAQTLAVAKTIGRDHDYQINQKQEMLASGACSVVSACLLGFSACANIPISLTQATIGGKTQVASLVTAIIVLLVILILGPYLQTLPQCVMAAIIIVSFKDIFWKITKVPSEWRKSRIDCFISVLTFILCVVFDVGIGLIAGVVASLLITVLRASLKPVKEVTIIQHDDLHMQLRATKNYSRRTKWSDKAKIVAVKTPLFFLNCEMFITDLIAETGIDPSAFQRSSIKGNFDPLENQNEGLTDNIALFEKKTALNTSGTGIKNAKSIVIDLSGAVFIDSMGVETLNKVIQDFGSIGINVLICNISETNFDIFKSTGFWTTHEDSLYTDVCSALLSLGAEYDSSSFYAMMPEK